MEKAIDELLEKYLGGISPGLNVIFGIVLVIYGIFLFVKGSRENSKSKKIASVTLIITGSVAAILGVFAL